jgi:hypothetical protein
MRLSWIPALVELTRRRKSGDVENHPHHADGDRRHPRPLWFDASLQGWSFKAALGDSLFHEQYLDVVAAVINAQEAAGLDIVRIVNNL